MSASEFVPIASFIAVLLPIVIIAILISMLSVHNEVKNQLRETTVYSIDNTIYSTSEENEKYSPDEISVIVNRLDYHKRIDEAMSIARASKWVDELEDK